MVFLRVADVSCEWIAVVCLLWTLTSWPLLNSVFGQTVCKTVCPLLPHRCLSVPEMTYNVFSGTLNPTHVTSRHVTASGAWCRIVHKISTNPRYLWVAAAAWDWLNFSRGWWTMRLISSKKRLVASINADDCHFEHLLRHCLPDIQIATQHNRLFSQPPVPRNTVGLFSTTNVWRETIYLRSDE